MPPKQPTPPIQPAGPTPSPQMIQVSDLVVPPEGGSGPIIAPHPSAWHGWRLVALIAGIVILVLGAALLVATLVG